MRGNSQHKAHLIASVGTPLAGASTLASTWCCGCRDSTHARQKTHNELSLRPTQGSSRRKQLVDLFEDVHVRMLLPSPVILLAAAAAAAAAARWTHWPQFPREPAGKAGSRGGPARGANPSVRVRALPQAERRGQQLLLHSLPTLPLLNMQMPTRARTQTLAHKRTRVNTSTALTRRHTYAQAAQLHSRTSPTSTHANPTHTSAHTPKYIHTHVAVEQGEQEHYLGGHYTLIPAQAIL